VLDDVGVVAGAGVRPLLADHHLLPFLVVTSREMGADAMFTRDWPRAMMGPRLQYRGLDG